MLYTLFFPSNLLLSSLYFSRSLQLPPFRNSRQPLGRIAGTPPPSPLRCVPSGCIARRVHKFLPSLTRVEPCIPTLLGAICWSIFCARKSLLAGFEIDLFSSHEVKPVVHRGDGSNTKTQRSLHFRPEWYTGGGV